MHSEKEQAAESGANSDQEHQTTSSDDQAPSSEVHYPGPVKLGFIIFSLGLAVFLYGLVRFVMLYIIIKANGFAECKN